MAIRCAIIGSGNIGTDLMLKILKRSTALEVGALIGIDPRSEGLALARASGITVSDSGLEKFLASPEAAGIDIYFDATSAGAHHHHNELLSRLGKQVIDLTPAAIGPLVVPVVNLGSIAIPDNVNMVTCGGQATVPIVAAVSQVAPVHYAEIISSISSRSAGPGTRANIDEFTETTAHALEVVGGARRGKAIIVLNPAEPPLLMRNTVYTLSDPCAEEKISRSVEAMVAKVSRYVPGYRLKQNVQFERFGSNNRLRIPGLGDFEGLKSTIFLEVEGAADFLPAYAGNLDIMTSAALAVAEEIARVKFQSRAEVQ